MNHNRTGQRSWQIVEGWRAWLAWSNPSFIQHYLWSPEHQQGWLISMELGLAPEILPSKSGQRKSDNSFAHHVCQFFFLPLPFCFWCNWRKKTWSLTHKGSLLVHSGVSALCLIGTSSGHELSLPWVEVGSLEGNSILRMGVGFLCGYSTLYHL